MNVVVNGPTPIQGTTTIPADKAICHRVALLCAISRGTAEVRPWASAEDCRRTLGLVEGLGVRVSWTDDGVRIEGVGPDGLRPPDVPLDCGESGTTFRLACGLLAGQPFLAKLTAAPSLSRRPMRRVIEPLARMGASIEAAGSGEELHPPLTVRGRRPLAGLTYEMPFASAQVKSALLIAGLYAKEPVVLTEPALTRDHTERVLTELGATVVRQGRQVSVEPISGALIAPSSLRIPGDFSSAAFLIVAASIVPGSRLRIEGVGLNPTRTHALEVLKRMGAQIDYQLDDEDWEPSGTVLVRHARLRGVTLSVDEAALAIDELPILMVAASAAEGPTRFQGLQELRVKEADRIQSMAAGLSALGARITVEGGADVVVTPNRLRGSTLDSFGDHRTVMSLAVAGLVAEGRTEIRRAACVRKSFEEFFDVLSRLTPPGTVERRAEPEDSPSPSA
ncbi:MAG: 3-phosphoshikimate 1-carboxyvinyltransferase [Candidatus Omnitrophica bacterium]|nr:3-phosphoshikimate 1-carboxyvinyltransferase [Candidatus Omnitrophota bacterium]